MFTLDNLFHPSLITRLKVKQDWGMCRPEQPTEPAPCGDQRQFPISRKGQ